MTDSEYMKTAISLAERGCGRVGPNPLVGAVIVKDGRIIGQGYHERFGGPHAERGALASCTVSPEGATLYVTLEPCCHHGKTPPCTKAIIESGISKVVVGAKDPNPLVAGRGTEELRDAGIEVTEGVLAEKCEAQNAVFFHYIKTKTPYVVMKYAMTLDGKTAAHTGKSRWITAEAARRRVHQDRHRYTAVMVGVGTVLADDPLLTCRLENGKNPIRIICDTQLRTPLSARLVTSARDVTTMIATVCADADKLRPYAEAGCRIISTAGKGGHVDLAALMKELGRQNIDSVFLEGGAALNWSALEAGLVNKVQAYIAPKILGGQGAKTPVAGIGVESPDKAFLLTAGTVTVLGEDLLIESEVKPICSPE